MTDLVARVLLKADASGLVGQARAGVDAMDGVGAAAVAAGVNANALGAGANAAAGAVREVSGAAAATSAAVQAMGASTRQAGAAAAELAAEQRQAGTAAAELRGALDQATVRATALETASEQLGREMREAQDEAGRLANELRQLQQVNADLAGRIDILETRLKGSTRQHVESADAANRNGYAIRNLGQQFGDMAVMIQGGISPGRAFATQAGQIGYALSEMTGKLGAVGRFLTGPWGIALTIAATFAGPLIDKLLETSDAARQAEVSTSSLGDAQSILADLFGKASSKIAEQNSLLLVNARIKAGNLRAQAAEDQKAAAMTLGSAGQGGIASSVVRAYTTLNGFGDPFAAIGVDPGSPAVRALAARAKAAAGIADPKAQGAAFEKVIAQARTTDFSGSSIDRTQFEEAISKTLAARANVRIADLLDQSLDARKIDPLLDKGGATRKAPKVKSTATRDEFGRDAEDRIAAITGQFDRTPSALQKTNVEIAKLDDLIDDLGRRKPPGFEALIASAEQAKTVVREGLIRSVADAFDRPRTLADQAAKAFGQLDGLAADLEKKRPPDYQPLLATIDQARAAIQDGLNRPLREFVEQQQASLAVGQAMLAGREDEADALRAITQLQREMGPLTAQQKAAVLATTQALAEQERQIERVRQRQQIYLNALGQMRDIVQAATQDFARGDLGQLIKAPGRLLDAFTTLKADALFDRLFEGAFSELKAQVTGTSVVEDASARMADAVDAVSAQTRQTTNALADLQSAASGAAGAVRGGAPETPGSPPAGNHLSSAPSNGGGEGGEPDIVVTGRRDRLSPEALFTSGISKVSTSIAGLFTNEASAKAIGANIGKFAGKGLEGAATGSLVSGLANSIGLKLNGTGSQIGGAIGNFLPIPGGSIIGSVVGGLLGGLFGKKAQPGGVTVGAVDGEAARTGTTGRDKAAISAAGSLGDAVASGVNKIVDQLGGTLGSFNVSIGKYKDDLRVNENGRALGGVKGSNAVGFGDDEAAAVSYGISRAIAQGAVQGLSSAVAKALSSSTDVEKALAEAVKVADLEKLLGGVTGQLQAIFKTYDDTAAERVRLAKTYGLDLLAVEKINAEQRADLLDSTLKQRVGSLKDLLSNLTYGDLFEGSAVDRRDAILKEIADAKQDADAGVAGAADRLADLYRQLVTTTEEAFGTAGPELAADRNLAKTGAEEVIKAEEARIAAAAQQAAATAAGIDRIASLTDESNDYLASIAAGVGQLVSGDATLSVSPDLSLTTRGAV